MEIADDIYQQSKILDRAISVADAILYPHKSLLDLSTVVARKFQSMHTNIIGHRHQFRPQEPTSEYSSFVVPMKLLDAVVQMWTWFQANEDVLFRVSLKLARLPIEDIVGILTASSMSAKRDSLNPMLPQPSSLMSSQPSSGKSSPFTGHGFRSSPNSPMARRSVQRGSPPVYKGYTRLQSLAPETPRPERSPWRITSKREEGEED